MQWTCWIYKNVYFFCFRWVFSSNLIQFQNLWVLWNVRKFGGRFCRRRISAFWSSNWVNSRTYLYVSQIIVFFILILCSSREKSVSVGVGFEIFAKIFPYPLSLKRTTTKDFLRSKFSFFYAKLWLNRWKYSYYFILRVSDLSEVFLLWNPRLEYKKWT